MANPIEYLRQVKQELDQVTWPSQRKTINMTVLVIAVSALVAVYIAGIDFVMQQLLQVII